MPRSDEDNGPAEVLPRIEVKLQVSDRRFDTVGLLAAGYAGDFIVRHGIQGAGFPAPELCGQHSQRVGVQILEELEGLVIEDAIFFGRLSVTTASNAHRKQAYRQKYQPARVHDALPVLLLRISGLT